MDHGSIKSSKIFWEKHENMLSIKEKHLSVTASQ